jgi:molybdate-binding protein/DNA-binding XRE family transcriptional regulator
VPDITNNLAALRKQRAVSASVLAGLAGISRQTIYAIESGSYIPNTAVALRLARALSVSMEDLFSLQDPVATPAELSAKAVLLPLAEEFQPGQPVRLCQVGERSVAVALPPVSFFLPDSDAVVASRGPVRRAAAIQPHRPPPEICQNRLLMAGCDPAITLLARHLRPAGIELVAIHQNSSQALALLKAGHVHIAGTHLGEEAVTAQFASGSAAVFAFAFWQEGLLLAPGNPKGIAGVQDLTRRNVTFINREKGSGSRLVFDAQLKKLGIRPSSVRGYGKTAPGHLPAACAVASRMADCCLATLSAARLFKLLFIPLQATRYDLVLRKRDLALPAMQCLLDVLTRGSFQNTLANTAGYDVGVSGSRVL